MIPIVAKGVIGPSKYLDYNIHGPPTIECKHVVQKWSIIIFFFSPQL
jgi:hypothetical protein